MKATFRNGTINRTATIELREATDWHLMETLTHALDFVTGGAQGREVPVSVAVSVKGPEVPEVVTSKVVQALTHTTNEEPKQPEPQKGMVKERPRTLPKVNAAAPETRMTTPLGDLFGDLFKPSNTPENVKPTPDPENNNKYPGFKEITTPTGTFKVYQVHYACNCGNKGKRYARETETYTRCHGCGQELKLEPDHPDGFPNRDAWGNFFTAYERYEG